MPTFTLKPNLRTLYRYLTTTTNSDFDTENPPYLIEELELEVPWDVFENVKKFESGFSTMLDKYGLLDHYDNLVYLTIQIYHRVWSGIQLAFEQYESKKRSRDLAQLLLMLKGTKEGKLFGIAFKGLTSTAKMNDTVVNDWISHLIIRSIETKDFPISLFGLSTLQMLRGQSDALADEPLNVERLKEYAAIRLVNPRNLIKKGTASICRLLLAYLNAETQLASSSEKSITDRQLNFLFDLLELLKQVDRLEIDSEPKDYLRTLLANSIIK